MYDAICDTIHRELEELDAKFAKGVAISPQELEAIDRMTHTMKSIATYEAMKEGVRKSRYREEPRYYTDEYRRY